MKRSKLYSVLLLALFLSGEVHSQTFDFTGGTGSRDNSGSRHTSGQRYEDRGQTGGTQVGCQSNDYVKLSYLKELFTTDVESFRVSVNDSQTELRVYMPEYISNCMKLEFEVDYKADNNVVVKAYNAQFSSEGELRKDQAFQKYVQCLKDEGIIKKVEGSEDRYKFDRTGPNVKTKSPGFVSFPIEQGELDRKKDVHAYFLSPRTNTAGHMGPAHEVANAPDYGKSCYWVENFNKKNSSIAYMSPESRAGQRVREAECSKDYARIVNALNNLDPNVLGNYSELKDKLEEALIETLDDEADKIYAGMREIKGEFSFDEKGEPSVDDDESVELLERYADKLRDLNAKVMTPYIKRIDALLTERSKAPNTEAKRKIDRLINKYKEKIERYSKKSNSLGYNDIMKLARYYGHTSEARDVEGFRLKSYVYGNMKESIKHPTKNSKVKVTFKKAGDIITDALDHFDEKVANVWEKESATRRGDASAALSARNRHTALSRARDERYKSSMQKVQSDYKSCVGWFQTQFKVQKCQQKAQMSQKRAMQQRAYYNKQIGQASTQYNHYMGIYQQYQRSLASTPGGLGFNDPFGLYQDPFGTTGTIDAMSYYNMGVGNNLGGAGFNPFGGAGMGMNGMGMNGMGMNGMGMMPF